MRPILRLTTVLSAVACLAALVAWPASFVRSARGSRASAGRVDACWVLGGRVGYLRQTNPRATQPSSTPPEWNHVVGPVRERYFQADQAWRQTLRFEQFASVARASNGGRIVTHVVFIPLWCPAVLMAVLPAVALQRRLDRRRRVRLGLCTGCGYDLRAATDVCPECGRPSPRATIARSLPAG